MKLILSNNSDALKQGTLLVIAVPSSFFPRGRLSPKGSKELSVFSALSSLGPLGPLLKARAFKGKIGDQVVFDNGSQVVALQGFEPEGDRPSATELLGLGNLAGELFHRTGEKQLAIAFLGEQLEGAEDLANVLQGVLLSGYSFDEHKTKREKGKKVPRAVTICVPAALELDESERDIASRADTLAAGTFLARDLVNLAPSHCTPRHLKRVCQDLGRATPLKVRVLGRDKLRAKGAQAFLSVAEGSEEEPFLIRLDHKPKEVVDTRVVCLVGKGITYDSGGYCIKSAAGLMEMKIDMAGAAAVIGAMQIISALELPIEVRGYVPTCENMISGKATKPGSVVTSLSGSTIEIKNTDAEGRLILADALALAQEEGGDIFIDIATLTGACMVALGGSYAGLFTDDEDLREAILAAGAQSGELFWPLPLAKEYEAGLKSTVADIANISTSRFGGAITAGLFLKHFVPKKRWAHLDIAGPSDVDSAKGFLAKGGTGFGARTLANFVAGLLP